MPGPTGLVPNIIKLSTVLPANCIGSRRIFLAINPDVSYGETGTTDFWNGVTPPAGGYTVYIFRGGGGPVIFSLADDAELINFTNKFYSSSLSTIGDVLVKYITEEGSMCVNYDYPFFSTNDLLLNYDAWFSSSYPTVGFNFYDTSGNGITASIPNGSTYDDRGVFLNGANQTIDFGTVLTGFSDLSADWTFSVYFSFNRFNNNLAPGFVSKGSAAGTGFALWFDNAGDLYYTHQATDTLVRGGFVVDTRYLVTMRYTSGPGLDIFVGGTTYLSKSANIIDVITPTSLVIGLYNSNYGNCRIYSVKKYTSALTDPEINGMVSNLDILYA
jgi:hypothetical protein